MGSAVDVAAGWPIDLEGLDRTRTARQAVDVPDALSRMNSGATRSREQ